MNCALGHDSIGELRSLLHSNRDDRDEIELRLQQMSDYIRHTDVIMDTIVECSDPVLLHKYNQLTATRHTLAQNQRALRELLCRMRDTERRTQQLLLCDCRAGAECVAGAPLPHVSRSQSLSSCERLFCDSQVPAASHSVTARSLCVHPSDQPPPPLQLPSLHSHDVTALHGAHCTCCSRQQMALLAQCLQRLDTQQGQIARLMGAHAPAHCCGSTAAAAASVPPLNNASCEARRNCAATFASPFCDNLHSLSVSCGAATGGRAAKRENRHVQCLSAAPSVTGRTSSYSSLVPSQTTATGHVTSVVGASHRSRDCTVVPSAHIERCVRTLIEAGNAHVLGDLLDRLISSHTLLAPAAFLSDHSLLAERLCDTSRVARHLSSWLATLDHSVCVDTTTVHMIAAFLRMYLPTPRVRHIVDAHIDCYAGQCLVVIAAPLISAILACTFDEHCASSRPTPVAINPQQVNCSPSTDISPGASQHHEEDRSLFTLQDRNVSPTVAEQIPSIFDCL